MVLQFDPEKTRAVIFDTEWYVPAADRVTTQASLKVNPAKPDHRFIGGVFVSLLPLKQGSKQERTEIFATSLNDREEKRALNEVYSLFKKYRELIGNKRDNSPDLITIGTGISRLDIPGLYARSNLLEIDDSANLYETYMKTRVVDLSEVAIPFLNRGRPRLLYPVTTNSIVRRFGIKEDLKTTGKSVWDLADSNDFMGIRKRVSGEIDALTKIYWRLVKEIFH